MTPQQAVGLASRLFAIWVALASFQSWAAARALRSQGVLEAAWVQYSVPAVYWLAAVVLWFFPLSIAHRLVPRTRYEDRMTLPPHQVVLVACIVLGMVLVVVRALPELSHYCAAAALWVAAGLPVATMDPERHVYALAAVMQLLAGLACMFQAHAIAARLVPPPSPESAFVPALGESRL